MASYIYIPYCVFLMMFGPIRKFFCRAAMPLPSVDDLSEPGSKLCDKQNKYVLYH